MTTVAVSAGAYARGTSRRGWRTVCRVAMEPWLGHAEALGMRLVHYALCELGIARDVSLVHLERVLAFLEDPDGTSSASGRRTLELPGGVRVAHEGVAFRLYREDVTAHARLEDE